MVTRILDALNNAWILAALSLALVLVCWACGGLS